MDRRTSIQRASSEVFDLAVIGGGFTGAGIALTAARKGWKVLVIDKHDFAFGTSSRSAKMIHGGLRYLEHLQVGLVKEALHEREHLLKEYPHLVSPQPFFMPIYHSKLNRLKLSAGLTGYDLLSGSGSLPKHKAVSVAEIKKRFPQLKTENLVGGFVYYDAKTNDARLVNEVLQQAVKAGAVAINYFELTKFNVSESQVSTIACRDVLTGESHAVRAKVYVTATGVWTDETLHLLNTHDKRKYMMPSKGIHLVVSADHFSKDCVMLFPTSNGDGRMIWCMPWENNLNIVGATDTDYSSSNERIDVTEEEVDYLLDSVNAHVYQPLEKKDILGVYAGIRPLLNDEDEAKKSNQRSRDYSIWWNTDNMATISGGKLTSFLSMAENCIKIIEKKFPWNAVPVEEKQPQPLIASPYAEKYGSGNALLIEEIAGNDPLLKQPLHGYPVCAAELLFFIRYQHALTIDDLLTRRTSVTHGMQSFDEDLVRSVSEIISKELNWSSGQTEKEIEAYRNAWKLMHTWKP
jgi:glycerol-3-phosphate dehydrogenase